PAAKLRVARPRRRRRPEAVDLGGGRVGARRRARRIAAMDRPAAARGRRPLSPGPETGGTRRLDRARAIVLTESPSAHARSAPGAAGRRRFVGGAGLYSNRLSLALPLRQRRRPTSPDEPDRRRNRPTGSACGS